jgi:hypothetical protein
LNELIGRRAQARIRRLAAGLPRSPGAELTVASAVQQLKSEAL